MRLPVLSGSKHFAGLTRLARMAMRPIILSRWAPPSLPLFGPHVQPPPSVHFARRGCKERHASVATAALIAPGQQPATHPQQQPWSSTWQQQNSSIHTDRGSGPAGPRDDWSDHREPRQTDRRRHGGGPMWGRGGGRGRGSQQRRERDGQRPNSDKPNAPPPPYKMILRRQGIVPDHVPPPDLQLPTGLAITWLGTSSGTPTLERNVSCTVVRTPDSTVLVDCGEGTHRQLPATGFDLSKVTNIYITHLHGDHCYGLGTTLQAIDRAKAAAAQAHTEAAQGAAVGAQEPLPGTLLTTHVWGPPGLAELLHAHLVITGAHLGLRTSFVVTELVVDEADALLEPQPLAQGCERLAMRRQAPKLMAHSAQLQATAQSLQRGLAAIPQVWAPRPGQQRRLGPGRLQDIAQLGSDTMSDEDAELLYGGRSYVASEGLVWDLVPPGSSPTGLRCLAAQLQHRVPCWGYVMQETAPAAPGHRRRKVVILGDTVNSRAIAPLALNCDVMAHEATFIEGMEDKCRVAQHSTAWMAGAFAHVVQAQLLVLTHFSARYHRTGEPIRQRGAGGRGIVREREISAEDEARDQAQAIRGLINEAQAQHIRGRVVAADDFFTINVAVNAPPSTPNEPAC